MQAMPVGQPGTVRMRPMLDPLARNWWLFLLKGLFAILFGVLTFVWPGVTLLVLVLLYGAYAFIDGVLSIIAAIRGGTPTPRWWLAIVGILGITVGILTLVWPGITGLVLLLLIAAWAIVNGIMEIIGAIRLRKELSDEWLLIASGVLSVIFGIMIAIRPAAGALAVVFVIGAFAIIYGAMLVAFAMRLRQHAEVRI